MRVVLLATGLAAIGLMTQPAHAGDPYRWCAHYSFKGAKNCYFVTLDQCRAAVSGNGGFCQPNQFYTGDERTAPRAKRRPG